PATEKRRLDNSRSDRSFRIQPRPYDRLTAHVAQASAQPGRIVELVGANLADDVLCVEPFRAAQDPQADRASGEIRAAAPTAQGRHEISGHTDVLSPWGAWVSLAAGLPHRIGASGHLRLGDLRRSHWAVAAKTRGLQHATLFQWRVLNPTACDRASTGC